MAGLAVVGHVATTPPDQIAAVLDFICAPVALLHTWSADMRASLPPDHLAHVVALFFVSSVVAVVLAVPLHRVTEWVEDASEAVLRSLAATEADLHRYASLHVQIAFLASVVRSWTGVHYGSVQPRPQPLPGVRAAGRCRRLAMLAGRAAVTVVVVVVGSVRLVAVWIGHPLGLYLLAAAGWVVVRPDVAVVEEALVDLWRAASSAAGLTVIASLAAVLAVVLAHGPGTRLRGRNAYARDVAVTGQAVLEAAGPAAAAVAGALDRAVTDVPSMCRAVVADLLEAHGRDRWRLAHDVVHDRGARSSSRGWMPPVRVGAGPSEDAAGEADLLRALDALAALMGDDVTARAASRQARRRVRWIVDDARRGCRQGRRLVTVLSSRSVEALYRTHLSGVLGQDDVDVVNLRLAAADAALREHLWSAHVYLARLLPLVEETHDVHRPRNGLQRLLRRMA